MSKSYKSNNPYIITNWGKILLDTSFIIRVINYAKNQNPVNEIFSDLMKYLSLSKYKVSANRSENRFFYISSITIAEILGKYEDSTEKSKVIAQSLNANNIVIIDFDEDSANIFNTSFCEKIGAKNQSELLTRWGKEDSKGNKQAINNDLMIMASGVLNEVDTVICVDKGMYRLGKDIGLNMIYVKEEYFQRSSTNFFSYFQTEADKDLLIPTKNKTD